MQLRECMTGNLRCADPSASMTDVARMMRETNVGCVPVCEGDRIQGILTDRDIAVRCVAEGHNPNQCRASGHMTREVVTASPTMSVEEALDLMARHQVRRLPVVENNHIVGIVSLGDLAVESGQAQRVGASLNRISLPIHQTEGGRPKVAAA